jgi:hypothetical protein
MIASLCPPVPSDLEAEGTAVPVSAVAPKIEDVPTIADIPEEADDDASDIDRPDVEVPSDWEAVDDAELELKLELKSDRLDEDIPDELGSELDAEVSSSLDVVEDLLAEDSVVGDEAEAVAATEAAEATEAIIDVTWV